MPNEIASHLSYKPASLQLRLNFNFFNTLCTVILDMESTTSIPTSLAANSLRVHFDLPSGLWTCKHGYLCFYLSIYLSIYLFRGTTARFFYRRILQSSLTISLSDTVYSHFAYLQCLHNFVTSRSLSDSNNILARVWLLAEDLPLRRYWINLDRSCYLSLTTYTSSLPCHYCS